MGAIALNTIAAIVVSLPERHDLLVEALGSVRLQTRAPDDTVIGIDPRRYGEVNNFNRLIAATDCDWVAFLDDDDLWEPEHLAVCEKVIDATDADVIVSRYKLVGRPVETIEPWHEDFQDLRFTNWIGSPSMVVARRSMFEFVKPNGRFSWVDWATYNSLLDKGAWFVDTKQITTQYRFGPWSNGSWNAS